VAATQPAKATSAPSATSNPSSQDAQDAKFVEELAREMEAMLLGLAAPQEPSSSADNAGAGEATAEGETARDEQILRALEDLFTKGAAGVPPESAADGKADAGGSKDAFRKIRDEAAERLRKSDTELQGGASADDELAELLGSGDEAELQGLLEGMMGQLMGKEVLYEPLKELNDKFPSYLASNADKLSASDLARYKAQHACASKIIAVFEDPGYNDDDLQKTTEIVELMSEMQEHGAPPAEIMGELPPGLDLGPDGAPKLPNGCVIA